jgi:hypothetical protein
MEIQKLRNARNMDHLARKEIGSEQSQLSEVAVWASGPFEACHTSI